MRLSDSFNSKGVMDERIELRDSDIHGVGLFAKVDIPAGDFIHITHMWNSVFNTYVNFKPNNLYNHSWEPNCYVDRKHPSPFVALYARKDIAEGEELTADYMEFNDLEMPEKEWK